MSDRHVVVVGGGVMGSATAHALATRGARVTLLEQFAQGHTRGASHGTSRIFRHGYDDQQHIALAAEAHRAWTALEQDSGEQLLTLISAVDHGDPAVLEAKRAALAQAGLDHTLLTPQEAQRRWPGLRIDTAALVHAAAGRLHADRAVATFQGQAARWGADLRHRTQVRAIEPRGDGVRVSTSGGDLDADTVVVTAGAWTATLFAGGAGGVALPPLRTTQEQPAHFVPLDPRVPWPSFVHHPGAELRAAGIYGLGSEQGVKIGEHATGPEVHPDERDFVPRPEAEQRLVDYARQWLPGVDPTTVDSTTCLYTCTPDHRFLLDRVGQVVVGGGFSGHGFKFAPAIGRILADLALDVPVPERAFFSSDRFHPVPATQE